MQELQFSFVIFVLVLFIAWYIHWNTKQAKKQKKVHTFKKSSFQTVTAKKSNEWQKINESVEDRIRRRLNTKYN